MSVVVPTFNCGSTLPATLASLAVQVERDFEVIVSDGASGDTTLSAAHEYALRLPSCRVLSRPDRGVYDAINLAIAEARGDWILVLGGDDKLHAADTLQRAAAILRGAAADVVYGDVRMMNANGLGVPPGGRYAGAMPLPCLLRANICQQAIFYRRRLFEQLGPFDLTYPIMADWDFNLRAAFRVPMEWVDLIVTDYAATGLSAQRVDLAAVRGIAEMVRREFVRRSGEAALWPQQRNLLRQADVLRRHGQWRLACLQLASYSRLRLLRLCSMGRHRAR